MNQMIEIVLKYKLCVPNGELKLLQIVKLGTVIFINNLLQLSTYRTKSQITIKYM